MTVNYGTAQASKAEEKPSIVILLTLLALITPVYFTVGGQLLSPSRILFLGLIPVLLTQLLQGQHGKLRILDFCVFFNVFWMAIAIGVNNPNRLFGFVGSNTVMILGGYLVGRCCIRNVTQFRHFAKIFGVIVVLMLPLAIIESLTTRMIIPPIIDSLPGISSHPDLHYPKRLGLDRAQVVFVHPIHYGLFASMAFSLIFIALRGQTPGNLRWTWSLLTLVACFFSFSSGPLLSVLMQIGMRSYDWVLRAWARRWQILFWGGTSMYVVLELLSEGPFYYTFIRNLTFNSGNAFVRRMLIEYANAQMMQTPLFGIGFNTWETVPLWLREMSTLDNHWFAVGLVYGIPAMVSLATGVIMTVYLTTKLDFSASEDLQAARLAWIFTTVSIIFTLLTVAVWGELQTTVFLFFAAGLWLFDAKTDPEGSGRGSDAPTDLRTRYSRFGNRDMKSKHATRTRDQIKLRTGHSDR